MLKTHEIFPAMDPTIIKHHDGLRLFVLQAAHDDVLRPKWSDGEKSQGLSFP